MSGADRRYVFGLQETGDWWEDMAEEIEKADLLQSGKVLLLLPYAVPKRCSVLSSHMQHGPWFGKAVSGTDSEIAFAGAVRY